MSNLQVAVSLLAYPGQFDDLLACPFLQLWQVKIWDFSVTGERAWKDLVDPPRFVPEMTFLVAQMTTIEFNVTTYPVPTNRRTSLMVLHTSPPALRRRTLRSVRRLSTEGRPRTIRGFEKGM